MHNENTDIDITDLHHRHKRDAPSGTAQHIAQHVAQITGQAISHNISPRQNNHLHIHSQRSGEHIGHHTVTFTNPWEQIRIEHTVFDRSLFAREAIHHTLWLAQQKPGIYHIGDIVKPKKNA